MGSVYGNLLKVNIFGESHGTGIGVVIDGFPAGIQFDEMFIFEEMKRRAPSTLPGSTARREADLPRVISGVKDGYTTGAPICAVIENTDTRSQDYSRLTKTPRPGHADFTAEIRYRGYQDPRGGGHFSGRLTAPLTFAGAMCKLALQTMNIYIGGHILRVGSVCDNAFPTVPDAELLSALRKKQLPVLDEQSGNSMLTFIDDVRNRKDSVGGVVECVAIGLPAGIGSPMFDTLESRLSSILFAIPAVRGVEFGTGFHLAEMTGSEANDPYYYEEAVVRTKTNHHGGALGGISTGMPILLRCAFKPTPSIAQTQQTVNLESKTTDTIAIEGRHDPCIVCRAVPVVESAVAVALLDQLLEAYGYANFG